MGVSLAATDGYDTNSDTLIDGGMTGYAGVYHEFNVAGWDGPTGFYHRDFRAVPGAAESKTWEVSVWADPTFPEDTMYYSMESFGTPAADRQYLLELLQVPDGVVNAPPVGTDWVLSADELNTVELPTYRTTNGLDGYQFAFTITERVPACDFDVDGSCTIDDLNEMLAVGPVAPGVPATGNERFDLTGDGVINNEDVDEWLATAATEEGLASPYKRGDANLDGVVGGADFILWNENRFTSTLLWDNGDFNGDGVADGPDFILWNGNRFTSSDQATVPEPTGSRLLFLAMVFTWVSSWQRQR